MGGLPAQRMMGGPPPMHPGMGPGSTPPGMGPGLGIIIGPPPGAFVPPPRGELSPWPSWPSWPSWPVWFSRPSDEPRAYARSSWTSIRLPPWPRSSTTLQRFPLSSSRPKSQSIPCPFNDGWPPRSSWSSTHSQVSIRTLSWLFAIQWLSSCRRQHAGAAVTAFTASRKLWSTPNVRTPEWLWVTNIQQWQWAWFQFAGLPHFRHDKDVESTSRTHVGRGRPFPPGSPMHTGPVTLTISAQMHCKVFLKQQHQ